MKVLAGNSICRKCHPRCKNCTAYGFHSSVCHECKNYRRGEQCEDECPEDHYADEVAHECKKVSFFIDHLSLYCYIYETEIFYTLYVHFDFRWNICSLSASKTSLGATFASTLLLTLIWLTPFILPHGVFHHHFIVGH